MKILYTHPIPDGYVVQTYSALVRGLSETFDLRMPTPADRASCHSYRDLCLATFGEPDVDVIVVDPILENGHFRDPFTGARESRAVRVSFLSDFWYLFGPTLERYLAYIEDSDVTYVLSLYPLAFNIYRHTSLAARLRWLPPTFDPRVFNDWAMPKEFDVGFIGSGVLVADAFYPEREAMHRSMLQQPTWRYFTRAHPGYNNVYSAEDLRVGRGFSRDINRCRGFLASGGRPQLPLARYFETLASGALVFGAEPHGATELGLVDGETYVSVTPATLQEKLAYYLSRPDEEERVRRNGYRLAMERHSCFQRAIDFFAIVDGRGGLP